MSSLLVEFMLPSILVTLLAVGTLTLVLRSSSKHALLGLSLMGWAVVLLLAEVSARSGNAEGSLLAFFLTFVMAIQTVAGLFIIQRKSKA